MFNKILSLLKNKIEITVKVNTGNSAPISTPKNLWGHLWQGKAPLWVVFWLLHMVPAVIANAAFIYFRRAGEEVYIIPSLHPLLFCLTSYLVFKTARKRWVQERTWKETYNPNFFPGMAILIVCLQWVGFLLLMLK